MRVVLFISAVSRVSMLAPLQLLVSYDHLLGCLVYILLLRDRIIVCSIQIVYAEWL